MKVLVRGLFGRPFPNGTYKHPRHPGQMIQPLLGYIVYVTEDTSAATATQNLWKTITTLATIPRFLTSDGGSSFTANTFAEMCNNLKIKHHVSLPHHPEEHSPIEREFRDINAMIRGAGSKGARVA
jgi:hypothetical protein